MAAGRTRTREVISIIGHGPDVTTGRAGYLRRVTGGGALVYSTEKGSLCPGCGWPRRRLPLLEGGRGARARQPVAKLPVRDEGARRKERHGGGRAPEEYGIRRRLAKALKGAARYGGNGEGGARGDPGRPRERLRDLLRQRGFLVKG